MISVIIPTYNRCRELPRAIDSVINQTMSEWELIIVDDGSQDETAAVVGKYVEKYDNVHYHYYLNMGASIARNIGISLSRGELIAFLDSDDIWTENRLSSVYKVYSEERGKDKFYLTDFRSNLVNFSLFNRNYLESHHFKQMLLAANFLGGTINMVIPRKILFELEGFDTLMTSTEDHDLYVRLTENYKVSYVPGEYAIYYLDTSNRISGTSERRLLGQLRYYHKHKEQMSPLSRLLVMKKNALLAYYIRSPRVFRYLHAWIFVKLLKKMYHFEDELELFFKESFLLKYLRGD